MPFAARRDRPQLGHGTRDRKGDEIAEFADAAMTHHRPPRHPQHGSPPAPWQKGQSALSQIRGSAQASRMRALTAHALAVRHRVPPALGDGLRTPRSLTYQFSVNLIADYSCGAPSTLPCCCRDQSKLVQKSSQKTVRREQFCK